jgi:AhpD family alkylhydroperoxidase
MAGSRLDRVAVRLLEATTRQHWGYSSTIMTNLVDELGPIRALRWMSRNGRRYNSALRALGPLRTHLACTAISMLNGCRYCTHGHAYAVELHHLSTHDRLFPVDADTMTEWAGLPRTELRAKLRDALMEADLHVELIWVDRALDLADGGRPIDEDETRIAHLVSIVETLNAVSIAGQPDVDDAAHTPLNKDARLKTRLATLRARQT